MTSGSSTEASISHETMPVPAHASDSSTDRTQGAAGNIRASTTASETRMSTMASIEPTDTSQFPTVLLWKTQKGCHSEERHPLLCDYSIMP